MVANPYYLTTSSGVLEFSYEYYDDDLYEVYYINVGSNVIVSFDVSIDLEDQCDYVYIYNIDHNNNETLIASLTGEMTTTVHTTSMTGRAKLIFETDESVSYWGGYDYFDGAYISYYANTALKPYEFIDRNLFVTGRVGIGVETPKEKLHVNGAVRGHGTGGALQIKTDYGYVTVGPQTSAYAHLSTDRPAFLMNRPLTLQTGTLSSLDNGGLSLQTAGQTRLTVDGGGRVGIGTASPQYDLDVKGRIRATEVIIHHIDSFPDYVFRPDYELRTVNEVEGYIREHGHLPGLPSATEVGQQGVSLSRLQLQLLEKVEELTLYVISQQRMLERQQEEIVRLKAALSGREGNHKNAGE